MYDQKKIGSLFFLSISIIIILFVTLFFYKLKCINKVALSNLFTPLIWTIVENAREHIEVGWSMLEQVDAGWSMCEAGWNRLKWVGASAF